MYNRKLSRKASREETDYLSSEKSRLEKILICEKPSIWEKNRDDQGLKNHFNPEKSDEK